MNIGLSKNDFKKFFRKFSFISAAIVLVLLLGYYLFASMTYSDGTRSGVLTKVSRKGIIFKTFEGDLALSGVGGYMFNPREDGNVWSFSIRNKEVYQKVRSYEGRAVSLSYKETFRTFPWWGETRYFVTDVKLIENQELFNQPHPK